MSRQGPRPGTEHGRIDRTPQNLGVPIGGFEVVRRNQRIPPLRKWWRARGATVVAVAGIAAAAAGGALSSTPPAIQVGRLGNGTGIRVGDAILLPSGPNRYGAPPSPVLIITPQADGTILAAGSGARGGLRTTGRCTMRQTGDLITEACAFTIGSQKPVTCTDTLDVRAGGLWRRIYADGQQVSVQVPQNGAAVPVPFPIGR